MKQLTGLDIYSFTIHEENHSGIITNNDRDCWNNTLNDKFRNFYNKIAEDYNNGELLTSEYIWSINPVTKYSPFKKVSYHSNWMEFLVIKLNTMQFNKQFLEYVKD